jgi:ABC-type xylose transport system permease subunit
MVAGAMFGLSGAVLTCWLNVATANVGNQFGLNAIAACAAVFIDVNTRRRAD